MPEWLSGWASAFSSGRDPSLGIGSPPCPLIGLPAGGLVLPQPVSLLLCLSWINKILKKKKWEKKRNLNLEFYSQKKVMIKKVSKINVFQTKTKRIKVCSSRRKIISGKLGNVKRHEEQKKTPDKYVSKLSQYWLPKITLMFRGIKNIKLKYMTTGVNK